MPNISGMIDRISDQFATDELLQNPVIDIARKSISQVGEINTEELAYLRGLVLAQLQNSSVLDAAIMAYMTEPKYPDNIPEPDEIEVEDLNAILSEGYELLLEPASRLLYTEQNGVLKFWGNGEDLTIVESFATQLKTIADGESIPFNNQLSNVEILENIVQLLNDSILMLLPPAE